MGACLSKAPQAQPAAPSDTLGAAFQDMKQQAEGDGAGWTYQGAPRPINEAERLGLLRALGVLDSEQDQQDQFDAITRLLCAVFNVPIALVSLVDAERQWFKSVQGLGSCLQTGREESFCAWTLLPDSPYVLVVEDALEDKRFATNPLVVGPPHIRFYAGAPLISSANGYRYGTLCVIDTQPHHEFAAEQYNMLIQFAELCVREIEKDKLATLQKLVQQSGGRSQLSMSPALSQRTSGVPSLSPSQTLPDHPGTGSQVQHWGLTRAVDCFREGVMLVDIASPTWTVLYTNDAFTAASGVPRDEATSQGFWEMFSATGLGPASFQEAVEAMEPFTATVGLQSIYSRTPKAMAVDFRPARDPADPACLLYDSRRPASTGQLGGQSQMVGIPATVPSTAIGQQPGDSAQAPCPKYYFGILKADIRKHSASAAACTSSPEQSLPNTAGGTPPASIPPAVAPTIAAGPMAPESGQHLVGQGHYNGRASMDSDRSLGSIPGALPTFKRAMPSAFTDVRLGPLIGRGAYGRVYRGSWNGTTVAVKVIETTESLDDAGLAPGKNGIFEAVLSSNLSHPNIVHTYQYAFRPVSVEEGDEHRSSSSHASTSSMSRPQSVTSKDLLPTYIQASNEVWLVSEFCNRGPLLTAIERGAFLTQPSSQYGQPNLISVLQTLQEIAAALQYLHRNDILHGDLTGGNVLLTASDKDSRGFTAKVVDFGLSRVCSGDYLRTRTLGCAEYMPPELITEGILTKAADVYAFGVITWEIYVGRRAWDGLKPTEVLRKVASNTRLDFPPQTPHRLKVLGDRCMEYVPAARPTMDEVLSEVNSILSDTMGILQQFLAASTAAAAGGAVHDLPPSDPFR